MIAAAGPARRVLFLADSLDGIQAGTEGQMLELARRLPSDWHVHMWVLQTAAPRVGRTWGPAVRQLHVPPLHHPSFFPRLWGAARAVRQGGFDLIHAVHADTCLVAPLLGRMAGVPVITSRRDLGYWQTPLHLRALRRLDRLADRILVNARAIAERVTETEHVPPSQLRVIYNGQPTSRFEATPDPDLRNRLGIPEEARLVGLLANLRPLKRPQDLLDALAQLGAGYEDVHGLWIGAGPGWDALQARAQAAGLGARVHRHIEPGPVAPVLQQLEVGVLCSDSEGLSNALIEYMGCGLPIVATAVGGTPELVEHEVTGLLYTPGDVPALAGHLGRLLADGDLRRRYGAEAHRRARERFAVERMVAETVACYEEVLAARTPAQVQDLTWTLVEDAAALEALAPAWDALLGPTQFFLGPDFVLAWLQATAARPCVAVARDDQDRLVGLLPLAWRGQTTLTSCGHGMGSDHIDVVAAPGRARDVARGALETLARAPWKRLRLHHVGEDSALRSVLRERGVPWPYGERLASVAPYVRPGADWGAYLGARKRGSSVRALKRILRRTLEAEGTTVRWVEDPEGLRAAVRTVMDLHGRRFAQQGRKTAFQGPVVAALHARLAERRGSRGGPLVGLLEVRGTAVAAIYALRHQDRLLYFQMGFDPDFAKDSPGRSLMAALLRDRVIGAGLTELDLLDGDEPYKAEWATGVRRLYDLDLARPSPQGLIGAAVRATVALAADARSWLRERR